MGEPKKTNTEPSQSKTRRKGKSKSKTLGELFAGLPTLPADTRLPRIISIAAVDPYAADFEDLMARERKQRDIDNKRGD